MNRVLQTTTTEQNKNEVCNKIMLNRELLFTKDSENFWIKYNDELIPIGGNCKQNKLEAGDNIELVRDGTDFFYLSGENGELWVGDMLTHQLTVFYISKVPLDNCKVSLFDAISSEIIISQKTLDFVEQKEEDYFKYSVTLEHNFFEKYRKLFICLQVSPLEKSGTFLVPQGNLNDSKTWSSFHYGTEIVRLLDDIDVNTCTLSPNEEDIWPWKGTENIGRIRDQNSIFLFMKRSETNDNENRSLLGGEILVRMTAQDGSNRYAHCTLTCSSTGSWALKGAAEAESAVRMIKAQWEKDYYYGIKLPKILKYTDKTVLETYSGYDFANMKTVTGSYSLRVGTSYDTEKNRNHLEVIDSRGTYIGTFTDTNIVTGNNVRRHIQYIALDLLIPKFSENGSFEKSAEIATYYGKGYYLYFDVFYQEQANNGGYTLRFLGGYICNTSGNYDPSAYPDRVVKYFDSKNSDVFTWNTELVKSSGTVVVPAYPSIIEFYGVKYQYAPWSNNLQREVVESTITEEPFEKAEVWFNGWKKIVPEIPTGYVDADLKYVVLSDTSHDNDSYAETFYTTAPEVAPKLEGLQDTGEDNAPYRFIVTGKISMTDLESIAALCRDPERQVYLDMSNAYVDTTAEVWKNKLFAGCVSLRGLTLPKGVTKIQDLCFIWCTYLRDLDFYPSAETLVEIGAASRWSTSVGLLTSTRVRELIIPASVNTITKYLIGSSNIRNLIFLHEHNTTLAVEQWSFMIISTKDGNATSELPDNFHVFVTKSWYDGFLTTYRQSTGWQWNNRDGWWTPAMVNSMVIIEPDWDQDAWQEFNDRYSWGEDLINNVRAKFGYEDAIEIMEKNII